MSSTIIIEASTPVPERPSRSGFSHWRWPALIGFAAASFWLYFQLIEVAPLLSSAEPSYAGNIFPWVQVLEREALRSQGFADEARFGGILLGLFGLYALAMLLVSGRYSRGAAAFVWLAAGAFLLLQVTAPVLLSSDLYSYVMYGRVSAFYGDDPYVTLRHYHWDIYEPLSYWKTDPSFYGPLWTLLSRSLAVLGGESPALVALLFRGVAIAATLWAGALIWFALRRLAPDRATQGMLFFLWNPLVVVESGLSGHNDAVMAAFLLWAISLHLGRRRALAVSALALSGLVKFTTLLLLPIYVLAVVKGLTSARERLRYVALSGASLVLTLGIVLALSGSGPQVLAVGALGSGPDRYLNGWQELAFNQLRPVLGEDLRSVRTPFEFQPSWVETIRPTELRTGQRPETGGLTRVPAGTTLIILAPQIDDWVWVYDTRTGERGYLLNRDVRKADPPPSVLADAQAARVARGAIANPSVQQANSLIRTSTWMLFALVWLLAAWKAQGLRGFIFWSTVVLMAFYWIAAAWFWPWYVIWGLALVALIPHSRPALLVALLSATALGLYAAFGYRFTSMGWVFEYRSLPVFLAPLAVLAIAELARAAWRKWPRADEPAPALLATVESKLDAAPTRQGP